MSEENKVVFKSEGEPAFPVSEENKDDTTSSESSTENKSGAESAPSSGENKDGDVSKKDGADNLADHPRWKEREDDWNKRFNDQETRHTTEVEKIREDIEKKFEKKRDDLKNSEVPSWFGGDEKAWEQYVAHENTRLAEAEDRALKRFEQKAEKDSKAIEEATKYMNDEVVALETDKKVNPDGTKIDRNKLLKFVLDNDLVDSKGRWNYRAAFQMMKANIVNTKKDTIDEKKKVANATGSGDDKGENKSPSFMTSDDFKKPGARPW